MGKAKLGFKIGAGFVAIIVLAIVLGGVGYFFITSIHNTIESQNNFGMPVEDFTTNMTRSLQGTTIGTVRFLAYHDTKYLESAFKSIKDLKGANQQLQTLQTQFPKETSAISGDTQARENSLNIWENNLLALQEIDKSNAESLTNVLKAERGAVGELEKFLSYMEELLKNEIAAGQLDRLNRRLERKAYADKGILLIERSIKQFWDGVYKRDLEAIMTIKPGLQELHRYTTEVMLPDSTIPRNIESLTATAQNLELLIKTIDKYTSDGQRMQQIIKELAQANQKTQSLADAAFAFADTYNRESNNRIVDDVKMAKQYMMLVCAVIIVLAIIIALRITRMVQRPVRSISTAFSKLVEKNFQVEVQPEMLRRGDELGEMMRDLANVCDVLSHTINEVRQASEAVSNSAVEISQGNNDLNNRTQQQAAAVEEIASALTQMTSSVRDSASNSQHANQLASKASATAQQGGEVVERTVRAMQEVTASSQKINEIINVVNEIAFQTNLLALNAAVEAARAGEAGKGFAVVAGEVRNLAGRSAEAAKQIQTLISDTVSKVDQGNALVEESGRLLNQIIRDAKDVAENISEVSSASQEQANTIDEINKAMNQMDSSIQQNAAMVEQVSSATEALTSSAEAVLDQMNQFVTIDNAPKQALLPR